MDGICALCTRLYATHALAAGLSGPELLLLLGLTGGAVLLRKGRYSASEQLLSEEVGQTPLYLERCGTGGKGGPTFQRLALCDQGMVLAQDHVPVFLRYAQLQEAWRSGLGPWSRVQLRLSEDAWRCYAQALRAPMMFADRVLSFASRDPDRILRILQSKGVALRACATAPT
jgi:hypothetical protein